MPERVSGTCPGPGRAGAVPSHGIAVRAAVRTVLLRSRSAEVDEGHGAFVEGAPPDSLHPALGEKVGCCGARGTGQGGGEACIGVAVVQMPPAAVVVRDRRTGGEPSQQFVEDKDPFRLGTGVDDRRPEFEKFAHLLEVFPHGATVHRHVMSGPAPFQIARGRRRSIEQVRHISQQRLNVMVYIHKPITAGSDHVVDLPQPSRRERCRW